MSDSVQQSQVTRDGATAEDAASMVVPGAHAAMADYRTRSQFADTDGDDGLPDNPRYEGPTVVLDQQASINPSAGNAGPTEQGLADVNATGPLVDGSVRDSVSAARGVL